MTASEHTATRRCRRCSRQLPEEAYQPSELKRKSAPWCRECKADYDRDRRDRLAAATTDLEWKRCHMCGQVKRRDAWTPSRLPEPGAWCRECASEHNRALLEPRRKWRDDNKTSRGCADCGYNDNPALLDFDHLDDSDSTGKFQGRISFSAAMHCSRETWERLKVEVQTECEVRCKPCHNVKTAAVKVARSKAAVNGRRLHAVPDITDHVDIPTHLAWDQLPLFKEPDAEGGNR